MQNFFMNADIGSVPAGEGVRRKVLVHSENFMVCELHFQKGAVGKPHEHLHEQCSYVVSGAFEFEIDGVKQIVRAGDATYKQPHVIHGCVCLEEGILIDVFAPERRDFLI